jgi:PhoH-like ATPase
MKQSKSYVVDTNVLLDDPNALFKLRNGNENRVFIPYHVLLELNKFKKDPRLGHIVSKVISHLSDHPEQFTILSTKDVAAPFAQQVDNHILGEIRKSGLEAPILVTNDKILQLQAALQGVHSENYKDSAPFKSEAEYVTGFVECREDLFANCFMWGGQGKPVFFGNMGEKIIDYQHKVWNVSPRSIYQNLALELMTDESIHVVSIQSEAGYGKSFLALATALYLMLERKAHSKIFVVKPMVEIGQKMGYLPGRVEEKMEPYNRYILDLLMKLHKLRRANRLFLNAEEVPSQLNPARFELLPLTYIRGMNIRMPW